MQAFNKLVFLVATLVACVAAIPVAEVESRGPRFALGAQGWTENRAVPICISGGADGLGAFDVPMVDCVHD
ncbi:hypothetical protein C8Q77DRAFT_1155737 [Trametes polyzona]|nr:hypothetical protein C8Q77DRAFT_1155737 [Trametes polyzona]